MKLKKHTLIILLLFIILFVCIGSVSALENQTDNIGENNVINISESPEILTASASDDAVGISSDENVISSNNRDWYVNASAADGGDGSNISPYNNFRSVLDNTNLQDGDNVYFAGKENYKGNGINVNLNINKQLNLLKYGSGEAVFDAEHNSRIFTVFASCINITGLTFINGNADNGGALYFSNAIANSNINATYTNNTARDNGGANYFNGVSNSNISGTYNNNTAKNGYGGANRFYGAVSNSNITGTYNHNTANYNGGANNFNGAVSNSNITGTYNHNTANLGDGGANYFHWTVSNSNINGTFTNNTARDNGGANYFNGAVSNSNITGTYINNTANYGGANLFNSVSNSNITGTYKHNTANQDGGANLFNSVSNSNITGTYKHNTANGQDFYNGGGANYFNGAVSNSNITGTYNNNTANGYGGANRFYGAVSNSNITGTYNNNTANGYGGANYFNGAVSNSNITGTYNNNTAKYGGANHFLDSVSNSNITGTYNNNTANQWGGANNFNGAVSNSNITGTYNNNTAKNGGANYFNGAVSNSNITGTYNNNTAKNGNGGANRFYGAVSNSNITGTYNNNTAKNGDGGANRFNTVSNSNITGTYNNNTAKNGGANYFNGAVSNSNITGTYNNNTANLGDGGANYFYGDVSNSKITGTYINNTASNAIIHFENLFNQVLDAYITNAIFLNNNCTYEIYARTSGVAVKDSWFGNNASNYMNKPNINDNVTIDNWLFLNATADWTSLLILDYSNITFKLYSTDGTNVSDFDNSKLPVVNLTLAATNGDVEKTTTLDNIVKYMATEQGKGSVTAKIENATYTICFDNLLRNVDLSVSAENITYPENEILTLTYNNTATGKVNITLKSKNYNKKIEADINQTITIADLPAGEYNVTVEYSGDNVFSNATSYANFTVEKITTEVIPDKKSIELFVDDEYKITYTLKPDYAVGNISFSSNDFNIASVDPVSGNIQAKAEGLANITISFSGCENYKASNATVKVNVKRIPTQITVNSSSIDMKVNDEADIGAILEPANAGNLTYKSSDENIVKVEDGKIIALKEGNATITVSFEGNKKYLPAENKTINVTVRLNDASVKVNNNTLDLLVDETFNLIATTEPKDLTVNFTSSNPSVVTVDNKGNVVAVSEGTATITVSVGGDGIYAENSTEVTITVSKIATEIILTNETVELKAYQSIGDLAALNPADAGNLTYKSSNEDIILVSEDGVIYARVKGTATVTVSFAGDDKYKAAESKNITVTVTLNDASVSVENDTLDLFVDDTYIINATADPRFLTVYYTSSDESVAVVTEYGNVKAVGEGTAVITLTVGNGETYSVNSTNVTVTVSKIATAITVDPDSLDLSVGDETVIVANLTPSDAGNVTFTSSDDSVVTVDAEGNVIAQGKGTAIITVSFAGDNKYAAAENKTIKVTVKKINAPMNVGAEDITVGENATIIVTLPDDAAGNVTATINGKTYNGQVNNGKADIIIPDLTSGNYTVPVIYSGDDKYNGAKGDANVTVNKADAAISIDAPPITEGDNATVTVTLPGDATGKVTVGNEIVTVKDGTASVVLTGLKAGITTVPVTYSGDDKYNSIETSTDVIVNEKPVPAKENLTIKATADEITEGENATVIITGLENATGNVSLSVNDKTYTAPINNSESVITVPGLTENVTAVVNYPGDDKYNSAVTTVNITVNRNTVTITAENLTKYYRDPQKFTVKVTDAKGQAAANKTVEITINGVTYKRTTDENGTAGLNINLNSGEYPVSVAVDDVTVNSTVTVMSTIDASDVVKVFRNDTQYNAIFTDVNGTALANITVSFNINGIIYNRTTDAKGSAKLNINLNAGEYIITAVNPVTGEMKSNRIKVVSLIESDDLTKYYRNASQFVVRIHSADGGYVSAGEEVKFNINGVFYTRTTNATGHTKLNINLNPGNYTITTYYKGCVQGNNIEVLPILSADDLVMKYRDGSQFKAKLVDGQGKPYANQNVQFNINGVLYNRITGSDGMAKLNINLMSGEYIITSSHNSSSIANKVTIRS